MDSNEIDFVSMFTCLDALVNAFLGQWAVDYGGVELDIKPIAQFGGVS